MSGIPEKALNKMADKWVDEFPYVAVFKESTDDGSHEASGGDYKRKKPDWDDAEDGKAKGSEVEISVKEGSYKEGGLYSDEEDGDYGGSAEFSDGEIEVSGKGAKIKIKPTVKLSD